MTTMPARIGWSVPVAVATAWVLLSASQLVADVLMTAGLPARRAPFGSVSGWIGSALIASAVLGASGSRL